MEGSHFSSKPPSPKRCLLHPLDDPTGLSHKLLDVSSLFSLAMCEGKDKTKQKQTQHPTCLYKLTLLIRTIDRGGEATRDTTQGDTVDGGNHRPVTPEKGFSHHGRESARPLLGQ